MINGVLLDTSFFIRLLNKKETLHKNAIGYFRFYRHSYSLFRTIGRTAFRVEISNRDPNDLAGIVSLD